MVGVRWGGVQRGRGGRVYLEPYNGIGGGPHDLGRDIADHCNPCSYACCWGGVNNIFPYKGWLGGRDGWGGRGLGGGLG